MNNTFSSLLDAYTSIELDAHISLDDALSKVHEELYELKIAMSQDNTLEIQKEAQDVLINILSVSYKLGFLPSSNLPSPSGDIDADVHLWSRQVSAMRNRYSREKRVPEDFSRILDQVVSNLVFLSGKSTPAEGVLSSIEKFRSRAHAYLPDIELEDYIDAYPDFPKPGILFRDIAPLLASPEALRYAGFELAKKSQNADVIVGLDARGFIFGTLVAQILEKPFVMIRKKGKLPGATIGTDYSLEYGDNSIEIQEGAIETGRRVVIIDDLLATGGTFLAAAKLVEKVGGKVEKLVSLISLDEAGLLSHPSRQAISAYPCESVLSYQ